MLCSYMSSCTVVSAEMYGRWSDSDRQSRELVHRTRRLPPSVELTVALHPLKAEIERGRISPSSVDDKSYQPRSAVGCFGDGDGVFELHLPSKTVLEERRYYVVFSCVTLPTLGLPLHGMGILYLWMQVDTESHGKAYTSI